MQLELSESLSSLVTRCFTTAKDAGHLTFSPTHLSIIHSAGIPVPSTSCLDNHLGTNCRQFQLRYCPALGKKPTGAFKPKPDGPKPDPFADPSPDLLVAHLPAENQNQNSGYALVLNKFPVIANHFIVATKAWKDQEDILEEEDLEVAYACIRAWGQDQTPGHDGAKRRLFAFFNSGPDSGASQPHRHLQFLPVEAMRQEGGREGWEPLIDRVMATQSAATRSGLRRLDQLPFSHFAAPIPPDPSADTLHALYLTLYRAAAKAVRRDSSGQDAEAVDEIKIEGRTAISYNLALTESTMMICPRRTETAPIPVDTEGQILDAGMISMNGTILGGTLMVKAEAEWDSLRANEEHLSNILATIGHRHPDMRELSSI